MKKILSFFALSFLLVWQAVGYDAVGHRIVADIAYGQLTQKARKQVDAILGTHGIVYYASWADDIKSDKHYSYSYQWHFQNLADGMSGQDIADLWNEPKREGEYLFYALDSLARVLEQEPANADALKFVVHFVGDCMQPMHLGRVDDLGGNKIYLKWFGKSVKLHTLWDRYLIENRQYSYSEFSHYLCDKYENEPVQQMTLLEAVQKCYTIRQAIYDYQQKGDKNNYHYAYRFNTDLDWCLYAAGVQLGKLLNGIYN